MAFEAEDRGQGELSLLDRPRPQPVRRQGLADNDETTADAGTDSVRARGPAPQERLPRKRVVVDSPPLYDDQLPEQDRELGDKLGGGFLRRHPFVSAIGLLLFIPVAAAGYLYWDYTQHFESTVSGQPERVGGGTMRKADQCFNYSEGNNWDGRFSLFWMPRATPCRPAMQSSGPE
jgi:hypothetical protein